MAHTNDAFYRERKKFFEDASGALQKKISLISNLRVVVALVFVLFVYLGFSDHGLLYILPLLAIVFILLIRIHGALFDRRAHLENLVRIQVAELRACEGDHTLFHNGATFIDTHHAYSYDLDLFGDGSLFQLLNRCGTSGGRQLLASRLSASTRSVEHIANDQSAVRELSALAALRQEIQALAMQVEEQDDDGRQLQEWVTHPSFVYGRRWYRGLLLMAPVVTTSTVVAAFLVDGITAFAVLAAAGQWTFLGFHLKQVNAFHQYISRKKNTLAGYSGILHRLGQETFKSIRLNQLRDRARTADQKVTRLASLVGIFDARMNSMTNFVVNSLLLFDLQCVYRLERWKEENASQFAGWLETVREIEVLNSLATFHFNNPSYVFPRVSGDRILSARRMGHPLLMEDERVVNDIDMDTVRSVIIITGANMAGKSTFLRTLGINVVLSLAGAPVCASEFICPHVALRTGMRTSDSLKDHQSYFYAELDRLKAIVDELKSGTPLLVLLDEILKGTNSTDKQAGSMALVKQFTELPCLVIIATHDLALGDLEQTYPGRVYNYSFEAIIEEDQLSFDYRLNKGLARNMNATFLMRKMGIIPAPRP